ncbi:MAG: Mur ligase family protein [Candidatus Zambryskibacteria bacterium]|nr:Mur ligase family protein [Candidatus Zambryskibacteria bacterium]
MDFIKRLTKKIFQYEARLVLKKYKPKIIAITGSVGKTLTREAVYLVLSKKFFVRKNEKSFTAEFGVLLTIIGCPEGKITPIQLIKNFFLGLKLLIYKNTYPDWLILEMDSDKPGDLSAISSFLSIDILVMTAIGEVPSHVESFYDISNLLMEKRFIINAVKREGVIIYNTDDSRILNLLGDVDSRKISCGVEEKSNIQGSNFKILYSNDKKSSIPIGMSFEIINNSDTYSITTIGSIGIHNEYALLLAFAVGLEFKIEVEKICFSLNKYKNLPGRMNLINGIKDTIIIDDSYNSSPIAVSQALSVFKKIKSKKKKIAVLGDMLELGKYSADEHRKIAILLKNVASDVICVGLRMRKLSEELLNIGFNELNIISVDSSEEAGVELQKILETGDIVLVKGSQTIRMEKVVEEVMRHPEDKEELLVRQEPEWLSR